MTATPPPGWRSRPNVLILSAAGGFALLTVVLLLIGPSPDESGGPDGGGGPAAVESLAPASPGTVSADYRDNRWRLAAVTDGRGTTEIPPSIDAWLQLATGGEFVASDGINAISGRFTLTDAGFDVAGAATTLAGYAGDDPAQWAAITGVEAVALGLGGTTPHVTVLSADRERLSLQAGGVRLTLVRSGPARTWPTPSCCSSPS